jgi:hypothetical protein
MLTAPCQSKAFVSVGLCMTVAGLFVLLPVLCRANIAPESGLLAHVQPVSGSCGTSITDCNQIVRSTVADGPIEFLVFFMKGALSWPGEEVCLQSLHNELSWPEAWQLVEFEPCGGGSGSLAPNGSTHPLDLAWFGSSYGIGDVPGGVIPVARLVMNVVGPGRLDIVAPSGQNQVTLRHNCYGSSFVTYPVEVYAEAGMQCGYVSPHCGYSESACQARFDASQLLLSALAGEVADSTVDFWATSWYNPDGLCPLTVETHASWCTGWIDPEYEFGHAHLHVVANAVALTPGTYATEVELSSANWGTARCLPVEFVVGDPATSTVGENPAAISTVSWGRVKAIYR